ncbi:type II toxin-antitoxin system VapC family toxin [Sphingomonas profundi]|uniref:type II toxin-antitoxin system VapC family toxin n=1 Tax=Alterirhizorhabdus profundi TaxID=2681549 RepID=UPI0012E94F5B|nr:type II toxin-antitoxin system VapC family toxin [Sphingomonas profundi]
MTLVVDSSAIVAIILAEAEAAAFGERLLDNDAVMAAPNQLETLMVLSRRPGAEAALSGVLRAYNIQIAPFTADLVPLAHDAFVRFGKGRHAAGLNFGDCIAYALARARRAPLLFKGRDFALTDVVPAL